MKDNDTYDHETACFYTTMMAIVVGLVVVIGLIAASITTYHCYTFSKAVEAGLEEGTVPGSQGTYWVKPAATTRPATKEKAE